MISLPKDYITKIKACLGDKANDFFLSYSQSRTQGLRTNSLKISEPDPHMAKLKALFQLSEVSWCPSGFYYEENVRPGKHPYHAAGVYYIQEPSAMSVIEMLAPEPGDIVLDLAAAPGGKSTHIAGKLAGHGLLIANEIHPARAKILSENIERFGVQNCVVTNSNPGELARKFPLFFDKIMVDAPCSGEGMFRKDPDAIHEWSLDHVKMCAARQMDILDEAAKMLKPGGAMAYSTCTFSPEENEHTVEAFMGNHPEFTSARMERIWPHLHKGEGHFVAVLERSSDKADKGNADVNSKLRRPTAEPGRSSAPSKPLKDAMILFHSFAEAVLPGFELANGEPVLFGEQLYWLPHAQGSSFQSAFLQGVKVLRPGLHLATVKKNRVEPAHALALAVKSHQANRILSFSDGSHEVHAYLKGEALHVDNAYNAAGWIIVAVDDYPLGWGKASGGQVKNHFPKGLRIQG